MCLSGRTSEKLKEVVTLSKLDNIVADEVQENMKHTKATVRMQDLFAQYHIIRRRKKLKLIIRSNQNVALGHVISATQPSILKERLVSELSLSHHPYPLKRILRDF